MEMMPPGGKEASPLEVEESSTESGLGGNGRVSIKEERGF